MQSCDLLQLAGLLAVHSQDVVRSATCTSDLTLQKYWSASRCRLDRWGRHLRTVAKGQAAETEQTISVTVIEEIIAGEVLTRVWTAIVHACENEASADDAPIVARSIMNGHIESRNRAMGILATESLAEGDARRMARLHRRVARWTDLLIAHLQQTHEVSRFAFDPQRSLDFADDLRYQSGQEGGDCTGPLTLAAMRNAICRGLIPQSPNADLNFQIGAAIVDNCDARALPCTDLFYSLWAIRLLNTASQCESMIDSVIADG